MKNWKDTNFSYLYFKASQVAKIFFFFLNSFYLSYVVSRLEHSLHFLVHVMMVQGHKERIDYNAKCDKKLDERVEDQEGDEVLKLHPKGTAVPNAKNIDAP